jgi:hypothetical protein
VAHGGGGVGGLPRPKKQTILEGRNITNRSQLTGMPAQIVCQRVIFITHCLPFMGHATVMNMMLIRFSAPPLLHTVTFSDVTLRIQSQH